MEVFDAELFAIEKAFKIAWENKQLNTDKVWIFSNNQAAIKRLKNTSLKAGQYYIQTIRKWAKKFQNIAIQLQLEWVPGHMNIKGNELIDKAAKKGTELQYIFLKSYISLAFIKRKIRETGLIDWNNTWLEFKLKGKYYKQFKCKPNWKSSVKIVKKQIFSSFFQLKIGHEYFKSYLNKAPDSYLDVCFIYNIKKNLEHLLLYCKRYSSIRNKLKKKK